MTGMKTLSGLPVVRREFYLRLAQRMGEEGDARRAALFRQVAADCNPAQKAWAEAKEK
jgi:hypothetical protein